MSEPLVVLVFVVAGAASHEPATSPMAAAARQALGPSAVLLLEERQALPSDEEALAIAAHVRATSVAEVGWAPPPQDRALLHVHTPQRQGWIDEDVVFAAGEPASEYGRTLGFALASLIAGWPAAADQSAGTPAGASTGGPASSWLPTLEGAAPPPRARSLPEHLVPPTDTHRPGKGSIEALALATAGAQGASSSYGAMLSGGLYLAPWFALDLEAGARLGTLAAAQANFSALQLGAGARWLTVHTSGARPIEVVIRSDLSASELVIYRAGAARSRWLPDATVVLEAAWFFITRNVGVVVAGGVDVSFGTTTIAVGNDLVGTIPPFRALGALGAIARF